MSNFEGFFNGHTKYLLISRKVDILNLMWNLSIELHQQHQLDHRIYPLLRLGTISMKNLCTVRQNLRCRIDLRDFPRETTNVGVSLRTIHVTLSPPVHNSFVVCYVTAFFWGLLSTDLEFALEPKSWTPTQTPKTLSDRKVGSLLLVRRMAARIVKFNTLLKLGSNIRSEIILTYTVLIKLGRYMYHHNILYVPPCLM